MKKPISKSELVALLAEKIGITERTVKLLLDELSVIACKEAKNTFTLPGIGKLAVENRKARMGRDPRTGERIKIPAKQVVKFSIAKAVKDAIQPVRK